MNSEENIHANLVGLAAYYLTRFMAGVKGLDDESIINAVKLTGFDVCYLASSMCYRPVVEIEPDAVTIENIRTMVVRSLKFLEQYGTKVFDGFTFEGGYTDVVSRGDGDFMTKDTLWDFKVSKVKPRKEYTLQLLMCWRMGLHSEHGEFKSIKYLGIYNPRMNFVYQLDVNDILNEVILEVEEKVVGYKN